MKNDINVRIAQYRKMAGFTQNEAALSLGIKRNTYARMELKGNPKPEMLKQLAALYNVPVDRFLYGERDFVQVVPVSQPTINNTDVMQPVLQQTDRPVLYAATVPFIPTAKEENIIKIIRNLPKERKDAVLKFIEEQYKASKG